MIDFSCMRRTDPCCHAPDIDACPVHVEIGHYGVLNVLKTTQHPESKVCPCWNTGLHARRCRAPCRSPLTPIAGYALALLWQDAKIQVGRVQQESPLARRLDCAFDYPSAVSLVFTGAVDDFDVARHQRWPSRQRETDGAVVAECGLIQRGCRSWRFRLRPDGFAGEFGASSSRP